VDFDSEELSEYPAVHQKVNDREIDPGQIIINEELSPIWDVPYTQLISEFERLGAARLQKKVS
jgi:hypothetical protein